MAQAKRQVEPARAVAPPAATPRQRAPLWMRILLPALLALAALAAFWPCLSQGFVDLDDDRNFVLNTLFRGLSAPQLAWMWSLDGFHIGHWHPLTWMSFGLDFQLYGLDGPKYHRVGLFAHAACVLALYFAAKRLLELLRERHPAALAAASDTALRACAALAALSWGLHPLRVESVAWVTERRDVLSAFFLLLSLLCYFEVCARRSGWLRWLGLALLAFAASLLCKAWGMTFPVLLLVIDLFVLRRNSEGAPLRVSLGRVLAEKLAFLPLAVFFAVQAARAQAQVAAILTWESHGLWQRSAQAAYGLFWYPLKTLWPAELNCMVLLEPDLDPTRPLYLAAQALALLTLVAMFLLRKRAPALVGALLCYGILVSPVLGFLQSGSQKVADRYAHLASIPFSLLLAAGVLLWIARSPLDKASRRRLGITLGSSVLLAGVLVVQSRAQTRVWKDSESLFLRAIEADPENYFMLHNLSAQYWQQGRYEEAKQMSRRSVAAQPGPGNEEARYSLGELSRITGDLDGALEAWQGALAIAPDHAASLQQLCNLFLQRKQYDAAVAACEASLLARPGFEGGWTILAGVHARSGQRPALLATWQRATTAMPHSALLQNGRGKALQEAGRLPEAEPFLVRAIELENRNVEYATDAGALFLALGRKAEAADLLRQIVAASPNHARAKLLLEQAMH